MAHLLLEQGNFQQAREYVDRAFKKAPYFRRDICLLTQAVAQWLTGETEASLATLKRAQQKNRHITCIKDLQYDHFRREKAIAALKEMLVQSE